MGIVRHILTYELTEKIRAIEGRYTLGAASSRTCIDSSDKGVISTGWLAIDEALQGGLSTGLHEWFASAKDDRPGAWTPPLCILVHLAWRAVEHAVAARWTIWVGKRCHPYPRVLIRGSRERGTGNRKRLLEQSLFVAPRDAATRLWAIDLALRSPAVGLVIADGSEFDKAATQRLQLLARSQEKWVLAARPPMQRSELSAAQTRWLVRAATYQLKIGATRTAGVVPRWSVELLRCKGLRPGGDHPAWLLEWSRAEGAVNLSAPLADLAGATKQPQRPRQQRTA